jgi:hypothetical protein
LKYNLFGSLKITVCICVVNATRTFTFAPNWVLIYVESIIYRFVVVSNSDAHAHFPSRTISMYYFKTFTQYFKTRHRHHYDV